MPAGLNQPVWVITPGVRVTRIMGLRAFRGISRMKRSPTTWPKLAVSLSKSGASAVTVMRSAISPTSSLTSRVRLPPTGMVIGSCTKVLKPVSDTVRRY
jgi:hypothetical protein